MCNYNSDGPQLCDYRVEGSEDYRLEEDKNKVYRGRRAKCRAGFSDHPSPSPLQRVERDLVRTAVRSCAARILRITVPVALTDTME